MECKLYHYINYYLHIHLHFLFSLAESVRKKNGCKFARSLYRPTKLSKLVGSAIILWLYSSHINNYSPTLDDLSCYKCVSWISQYYLSNRINMNSATWLFRIEFLIWLGPPCLGKGLPDRWIPCDKNCYQRTSPCHDLLFFCIVLYITWDQTLLYPELRTLVLG